MTFDKTTRRLPRHHWLRVTVGWMPDCAPGHGWLYANIVRRDAWIFGPFALVVMRMPRREVAP